MTASRHFATRGRLASPPGFTAKPWRGLGTREGRLYLLYSLACQPNPDRERAGGLLIALLAKIGGDA